MAAVCHHNTPLLHNGGLLRGNLVRSGILCVCGFEMPGYVRRTAYTTLSFT